MCAVATTHEPISHESLGLPEGCYVVTSWSESQRGGVLVRWVQQCAESPPLIAVSVPKRHSVAPMVRDSGVFSVCLIDPSDTACIRAFGTPRAPDEQEELFDSFPSYRLVTGAPMLRRAVKAFDCELTRHVDIDSDYELFVGRVVGVTIRESNGDVRHLRPPKAS